MKILFILALIFVFLFLVNVWVIKEKIYGWAQFPHRRSSYFKLGSDIDLYSGFRYDEVLDGSSFFSGKPDKYIIEAETSSSNGSSTDDHDAVEKKMCIYEDSEDEGEIKQDLNVIMRYKRLLNDGSRDVKKIKSTRI